MLLWPNGQPRDILLFLATRHGIDATNTTTARELSDAMQEKWLRKTEHQYQIPVGPPSVDDLALLTQLELVRPLPALPQPFSGVLLLGATVTAVRKRLAFVIREHNRFAHQMPLRQFYMLGGARPLDPVNESPEVLCTSIPELSFWQNWVKPEQMPTTEADMMHLVLQQSQMPSWPVTFIHAPVQTTPEGGVRNPNTGDTAKEWLKTSPPKGDYLVVSSQPFVARQTMNVQEVIPASLNGFKFLGCGYAAPPTTPLRTFLDEVARLLFEEVKLLPT